MKKWLTLMALAGGILACADDQTNHNDVSIDDNAPLAQFSSAAKVTNTGAACSSNNQCTGSAARCLTSIPIVNTPVDDGLCTASCTRDSECGSTGGCPLAQVANLAKTFIPDAGSGADLSVCLPKCRTDSECREGRTCREIPIPNIPFLLSTPSGKYCLPPTPQQVDGGFILPDGGFVAVGPDGRLPDGGTIPGLSGLSGIPGFSGLGN